MTDIKIEFDCSYDELVRPYELKPHPRNNNRHSVEQINRFKQMMIRDPQWRHPIIVSKRSGYIIAGHLRHLIALEHLNLDKVPVNYQDFKDDAHEYRVLTNDNEIARWAKLDFQGVFDALEGIEGLDAVDLAIENFDFKKPGEEKEIEDVGAEISSIEVSTVGDLWQLGDHKLICGSSTEPNDLSFDFILTDPPYGIDINFTNLKSNACQSNNQGSISGDKTIDAAVDFYNLNQAHPMVLFGANYFSSKLSNQKCWIAWDKRGTMPDNTFAGLELAWTNINKHSKLIKCLWSGMIKEGENSKRIHPTQKPIKLLVDIMEYLEAGQIVYDGFTGSGSTLMACVNTNRKFIGHELDPKYVDATIKRWQNATGKDAILKSNGKTFNELFKLAGGEIDEQ